MMLRSSFSLLVSFAALSACAVFPAPSAQISSPQSQLRAASPTPIITGPSMHSDRLHAYYTGIENRLVSRGLLRIDGGGPDTPFTDTQLTRNFIRIALFDEYVTDGDYFHARTTASQLSRWSTPVRMSVKFGDTIPIAQRAIDRSNVAQYADRLASVTGHPITVSDDNPNFHVMFLNESDRHGSEARLRKLVPSIEPSLIRAILSLPSNQLCIVIAFSEAGQWTYTQAIAVIRGEHPNLLRKSCIHEELAQGLGLPNDSSAARPSIFNDDDEFSLLTTHDEMLLRMLYDPRLSNGMNADAATPIIRQIATELTSSGAS